MQDGVNGVGTERLGLSIGQVLTQIRQLLLFDVLLIVKADDGVLPLVIDHRLLGLFYFGLQLVELLFHPSGSFSRGLIILMVVVLLVVIDQSVNDPGGQGRVGALKAYGRDSAVSHDFHV